MENVIISHETLSKQIVFAQNLPFYKCNSTYSPWVDEMGNFLRFVYIWVTKFLANYVGFSLLEEKHFWENSYFDFISLWKPLFTKKLHPEGRPCGKNETFFFSFFLFENRFNFFVDRVAVPFKEDRVLQVCCIYKKTIDQASIFLFLLSFLLQT